MENVFLEAHTKFFKQIFFFIYLFKKIFSLILIKNVAKW